MANPTASVIAKGQRVEGAIRGAGSLVVEGEIEGSVNLDRLTVESSGVVHGDVDAAAVLVLGRVEGNVDASQRIDVKASAVVHGDVRAPTIVIEEGAEFRGNVHMDVERAEGA